MLMSTAIHLDPSNATTYYNLGNALERSHQSGAAVEQYKECLRLDPVNAQALANLASAYVDIGRNEEAIAAARKAITLARQQGDTGLAERADAWLAHYLTSHPPADSPNPDATSK